MKRFDDVIKGMTDNQKIGFICSSSFEKEKIEGTNAYTISFYTEEIGDNGSLYQLAISLNDSLIENYLLNMKKNSKNVHIGSLLDKTNNRVNTISSSKFINDHILSVYYESLKKACTKTALLIPYSDDDIDRINSLYHEFYVITHSYPDYLICNNYLDKSRISTYKFTNEMIINCEDLKTIVKAINHGYFYAVCSDEVKGGLLSSLLDYRNKKEEYDENKLTEEEFNSLIDNGEILDENRVNEIISKRLQGIYENFTYKTVDDTTNNSHFDELTIMYKNDGILPLNASDEITIIGDLARNNLKNIDVVSEATNYNLNSKFYTHGYSFDGSINADVLIDDALQKSQNSIALVYVGNNELLCDKLPENQITLLKHLQGQDRKVVVVYYTYQYFDKRVLDYANAVLVINDYAHMSTNIFDILLAKKNPSGKTLWYTPLDPNIRVDEDDPSTYLFPFGYGLTYGKLEVSDYRILDGVVEFGAKNNSKYEATYTAFLYLALEGDKKEIKGFAKFRLDANESIRIGIPIDNRTFITYNKDKHNYEIVEGKHTLMLTDGLNVLASETIDMIGHVFLNVTEINDNSTKEEILATDTSNKIVTHSIKLPLIFGTIFSIYLIVSAIILAVIFKNLRYKVPFIISIALAVVIFITYIIILIIKLKKKKTHKKVSYEDLIKNMDEFKKDVELSYERPIKEVKDNNDSIFEVEKNEFEDESIDSDEKTDKELLDQNIFDESELTEEEISEEINNKLSASTIDAEKLTESFVNFLANFQITTSYKSIKQLFASLPASKILYIKSNDLNKLEIFVNALQAYTDSPNITLDLKDMESFTDLIKDFNSSFVKLLIEASKNKNKVHFVYIKDIKKEKFERLLAPFIVINRSNSNISINIDKKIIPISKNIYFIIPQSLGKENDESVTIDINLADAQKEEYLGPLEPLNINSLLNVINEYQEEVYVSEEDFKKFDDLFDELSTDKQLSLSNRSTLDFDKIYLLLIFAGLDKSEAIDILLRERIVPQLKKLNIYKNNKPELLKTVIRIFGEDNIALSLKELRDSEVDNNE